MMRDADARTSELSTEAPTAAELSAEHQNRLAEILDAYLVAIEKGSPLSPAELLARHPADAEYLRVYLSGLQLFHAAADEERRAEAAMPLVAPIRAGRTIGEFEIVREIGRGGMGVVYEAMQRSLDRRIALKVLPFSAAGDAKQLGRFKNEAQAAAQVQHPNIVPVFAVGEADGLHYFAMQLIEGHSLAELLAGESDGGAALGDMTTVRNQTRTLDSLSLRGLPRSPAASRPSDSLGETRREEFPRLVRDSILPATPRFELGDAAERMARIADLGRQAAEALHAAHEYGVIHRDVKPSNLLVDRHGKLWVADFGLARRLDGGDLTRTGDVCGTMRYMSPEQALGQAALVDHRTDVYSLGVTLYELTARRHPAGDVADLKRFFDGRGVEAKALRAWDASIPVDFETIVMKAIAEAPADRYATADELGEDLRRFAAGEPILASPPSRLARARRWVDRHKRGAAAGAFSAVVCLVALAYAAGARTVADDATNIAFARFKSMGEMLSNLPLSTAEQLAAIPGTEGVRQQLLEQSLDYYKLLTKQTFRDRALGADLAIVYSRMGGLNAMMGDREKALAAHREAEQILEPLTVEEPDNVEYARSLALCRNNAGLVLADMGCRSEALAELDSARQALEGLYHRHSDDAELGNELAATYSNLGLVAKDEGRRDQAARWFAAAIATAEKLLPAAPADEKTLRGLAAAYNNLGSLQESVDAAAAQRDYEQAITMQKALVRSHPLNQLHESELARSYNNLGYVCALAKDWPRAQRSYDKAILLQTDLREKSPQTAGHRRDLAVTYNNQGMALAHIGRLNEASQAFEQALALERPLLAVRPDDGPTLSTMGGVYNNLGMLLEQRRLGDEAEQAFRQAIGYQRRALVAEPDNTATRELLGKHYFNLSQNLRERGQWAAAFDAAMTRQQLWDGDAERLLASAHELAEIYGSLPSTHDNDELRAEIFSAGVQTLHEATAAGLAFKRLHEPALAAFLEGDSRREPPTS